MDKFRDGRYFRVVAPFTEISSAENDNTASSYQKIAALLARTVQVSTDPATLGLAGREWAAWVCILGSYGDALIFLIIFTILIASSGILPVKSNCGVGLLL